MSDGRYPAEQALSNGRWSVVLVCIFQSWCVDEIVSRADEAEEESETRAES